jgi:hypothetical protein
VACLLAYVNLGYATPNQTDAAPTFNSAAGQAKDFDPTGWELALVTTPSSNISATNERQLVGLLFFLSFFFVSIHTYMYCPWSFLFVG